MSAGWGNVRARVAYSIALRIFLHQRLDASAISHCNNTRREALLTIYETQVERGIDHRRRATRRSLELSFAS